MNTLNKLKTNQFGGSNIHWTATEEDEGWIVHFRCYEGTELVREFRMVGNRTWYDVDTARLVSGETIIVLRHHRSDYGMTFSGKSVYPRMMIKTGAFSWREDCSK